MKIRKKNIKEVIEVAYKNIKPLIEPRDGFQHMLLLNDSLDDLIAYNSYGDVGYTLYSNNILTNLQKDGYEIIDIKASSNYSSATGTKYQLLIIYK